MIKKQPQLEKAAKTNRFFSARGGRKTANALARVYIDQSGILVNEKNYKEYFRTLKNQIAANAPLELLKLVDKIGASVKVSGGGINAQAEAVRNSISKALVRYNNDFRLVLRRAGFLTRDARMVERKKYGLRKARRAPQWAKR